MKEQEFRILHVEDLPSDAVLAEREISKVLKNYSIRVVETEADFISELEGFNPHIVVSDYQLPSFNGLSALKIVLDKSPITPVIILTGSMNEDTAVDCMKAGASDYVIKEHIKRLGSSILNALEQKEIKAEKTRTEEALQKSEEKFRSLFENHAAIKLLIDAETGSIVDANKAAVSYYGWSIDELKRMNIGNLNTLSIEEVKNEMLKVRNSNQFHFDFVHRRKDGSLRNVEVFSSKVEIGGKDFLHSIIHDVTEKKHIFEELVTAKEKAEESERLKTAFLHNISHEIRTPMNAILGFTGFLDDPDLIPEKRKYFIEIINQSGVQLLSIISDIVSIATIEAGQEKIYETEINLNATLRLLYEQFLLKAQMQDVCLSLKSFLPDHEDWILSDATKLVQVLTNLIGNALKFTQAGYVNFGYEIKDNELEFFVDDTGIGIPPEMHEEIFKRFRQVEVTASRQFGGSGLGLSISKAYIELLGGKMWLNSELSKGSTFYFTIPYKKILKIALSEKQFNNNLKFETNRSKTLLIAEDEDSNFILLEELLLDLNINIIRAINGVEAVEKCKSNQNIVLVLMDIKMPVMDGYEASKQIREFMPCLPIIVQTAYTTDMDKHKAFACGCNDFISKPIDKELLISKIKEQLYKIYINAY